MGTSSSTQQLGERKAKFFFPQSVGERYEVKDRHPSIPQDGGSISRHYSSDFFKFCSGNLRVVIAWHLKSQVANEFFVLLFFLR